MAIVTSKAAGNWSAAGTWDSDPAIPATGDDVVIAHAVSLNTNTAVLGTLTGSGTGVITWAAAVGSCTISCTTITPTTGTGGFIVMSGNTPASALTITCSGGILSGASCCVYNGSTSTVTINGNMIGGSGNTAYYALYAGGPFVVNGTVTGGASAHAIRTVTTNIGTINGNITGSAAADIYGLYHNGTVQITVNGNITGGGAARAYGALNNSTGTIVLTGNIIDTASVVAVAGKPTTWAPASNNYHQLSSGTKLYVGQMIDGIRI